MNDRQRPLVSGNMSFRRGLFEALGTMIRALPPVRGKVRFGLWCYKRLIPKKADIEIQATLFRERLRFVLNLQCAHERMSFLMDQYEDETSALLAELYYSGTILDVGANIGLIALPLAVRTRHKKGASGVPHVYALEPLASNFRALSMNIQLNSLGCDVRPIHVGVGSKEEDVFIQIEGDNPKRTGTANILPSEWEFRKIPLRLKTLDGLIGEGVLPDDVSLVKVDTDGYDFEVLKGAERLLATKRPVVLAELMQSCMVRWHGYGIEDVVAYLGDLDYEVWAMVAASLPRFARYARQPGYTQNCLLVPREQCQQLVRHLVA